MAKLALVKSRYLEEVNQTLSFLLFMKIVALNLLMRQRQGIHSGEKKHPLYMYDCSDVCL